MDIISTLTILYWEKNIHIHSSLITHKDKIIHKNNIIKRKKKNTQIFNVIGYLMTIFTIATQWIFIKKFYCETWKIIYYNFLAKLKIFLLRKILFSHDFLLSLCMVVTTSDNSTHFINFYLYNLHPNLKWRNKSQYTNNIFNVKEHHKD